MKPRLTWKHTRSIWDSTTCGCSSYASGRFGRRLAQTMRCKRRAALDTSQAPKVWLPYIAITLALRCGHQNHVVYPIAWRKELDGLIRWRRHDMTICFCFVFYFVSKWSIYVNINLILCVHICLSNHGFGLGNYDQTTCTQLDLNPLSDCSDLTHQVWKFDWHSQEQPEDVAETFPAAVNEALQVIPSMCCY